MGLGKKTKIVGQTEQGFLAKNACLKIYDNSFQSHLIEIAVSWQHLRVEVRWFISYLYPYLQIYHNDYDFQMPLT